MLIRKFRWTRTILHPNSTRHTRHRQNMLKFGRMARREKTNCFQIETFATLVQFTWIKESEKERDRGCVEPENENTRKKGCQFIRKHSFAMKCAVRCDAVRCDARVWECVVCGLKSVKSSRLLLWSNTKMLQKCCPRKPFCQAPLMLMQFFGWAIVQHRNECTDLNGKI